MKHRQFKEWIHLSVVGEASAEMQELLEIHVRDCPSCSAERARLKAFTSVIAGHAPVEVGDDVVREARQQLHSALLEQRLRHSPIERLSDSVSGWMAREYRGALAGLALSAAGVLIGYVIFSQPHIPQQTPLAIEPGSVRQAVEKAGSDESFAQGDTRTSNVHLMDAGTRNGVVEFTFDAVTPMHVRGSINDEKIQKVLARALMTDDNAGVRLRTVNALASQPPSQKNPDPGIKAALISALKEDQNTGVRQEALRALLHYPFDPEIREALVYTLAHDKNSGMRIAAINGLATATVDGYEMDRDVLEILKHKMQSDNNNYVRRQAHTVLEEVAHR